MMVSVISEIGVATVNYDMRRLSEILAFPKAWYNRSIARRLFLGESIGKQQSKTGTPVNAKTGEWRTAVRVSTVLRELRIEMNIGNVLGKTTWINQELIYHGAFDLTQGKRLIFCCNQFAIAIAIGDSNEIAKKITTMI